MVPLLDLTHYFILCIALTLAGRAVVRACLPPLDAGTALLLSPCASQALWGVVLGAGVMLGWPVSQLSTALWTLTGLLAIAGGRVLLREPRADDRRDGLLFAALIAACLLLPLALLVPHSVTGLTAYVGAGGDGWSYAANGQYLWRHPRGTQGGLPLIDQWAAHLSATRYVASAQLAAFSVLIKPGDTQAASGPLLGWSYFVYGAGVAAMARSQRLPAPAVLLCVLLAVFSGWSINLRGADNYDNLLAMAYLPGMMALLAPQPIAPRTAACAGALGAALLYGYPELCWLILASLAGFILPRDRRTSLRGLAIAAAMFAAAFLLIGLVYIKESWVYVLHQAMSTAKTTGRPGEGFFAGLVIPGHALSAVWALGAEFPYHAPRLVEWAAGLALSILLAIGGVRLAHARAWGVLGALLFAVAGVAFLLIGQRYAYGGYKILAVWWPVIILTVVCGVSWLFGWPGWPGRAARLVAIASCLAVTVVTTKRLYEIATFVPRHSSARFRPVQQASAMIAGQPVAFMLADADAAYWALYYLRGCNVRLAEFPNYLGMPHVQALLHNACAPAGAPVRFVLMDDLHRRQTPPDAGWTLVWVGGEYSLWHVREMPQALLLVP